MGAAVTAVIYCSSNPRETPGTLEEKGKVE
jgi:hypothetical protein